MRSITKDKKLLLFYEIFIALLAFIAVSLSFLDILGKISIESSSVFYFLDISILIVFAIDYFIRLVLAGNKRRFFKQNILALIAIIPFNSLFRAFRLVRLVKVLRLSKLIRLTRFIRLFAFSRKFLSKVDKFIHTNGFIYVINLTITTIILGSIGIYYVEQGFTINSFEDAIWWSFVTTTTVGYGDISPVTSLGRIIAAVKGLGSG
ncbi:ion transporter [Wukongibacter sp. M2B1]|uniref:ion transporter n=1 Tax=Wukongibacter sp. M2B1 TaxID=3088895 RepID=UPI003D793AC4